MMYTNTRIFIGIIDDCRGSLPLKEYQQNGHDIQTSRTKLVADYIVASHLILGETLENSAKRYLEEHVLYRHMLKMQTLAVSFVTEEEPIQIGTCKGTRPKAAAQRNKMPGMY